MTKRTKMIIGGVAAAGVGYVLWKRFGAQLVGAKRTPVVATNTPTKPATKTSIPTTTRVK